MEIKTKALCVTATDYGEKDRLLVLVTPEYGKIVARIRSVRTPNSKLKVCASHLCFGEYILNSKAGHYTVIGASPENNFFGCWSDVDKNCAAGTVTEALDKFTENGVGAAEELALALEALYHIDCGDGYPYVYAAAFLLKLMPCVGIDAEEYAALPRDVRAAFGALSGARFDELDSLELTLVSLIRALTHIGLIYQGRTGERLLALASAIKLAGEADIDG